jgi:hypothetical protein
VAATELALCRRRSLVTPQNLNYLRFRGRTDLFRSATICLTGQNGIFSMSEHGQIVNWTIDLQGEPNVLFFWALKFSRVGGPRYWVEREETTLPRYYLHSSKFDGLRDTEI